MNFVTPICKRTCQNLHRTFWCLLIYTTLEFKRKNDIKTCYRWTDFQTVSFNKNL